MRRVLNTKHSAQFHWDTETGSVNTSESHVLAGKWRTQTLKQRDDNIIHWQVTDGKWCCLVLSQNLPLACIISEAIVDILQVSHIAIDNKPNW